MSFLALSTKRKKDLGKTFKHRFKAKDNPSWVWRFLFVILVLAAVFLIYLPDRFPQLWFNQGIPEDLATFFFVLLGGLVLFSSLSIFFWTNNEERQIDKHNEENRKKLEPKPTFETVRSTFETDLAHIKAHTLEKLKDPDFRSIDSDAIQIFQSPFRQGEGALMVIDDQGVPRYSEYELAVLCHIENHHHPFIFFNQGVLDFITGEWTEVFTRVIRYEDVSALTFERLTDQVRLVDKKPRPIPMKVQEVTISAEGGQEIQFAQIDSLSTDLNMLAGIIWRLWVILVETLNEGESMTGLLTTNLAGLNERGKQLDRFAKPTGEEKKIVGELVKSLYKDDLSRAEAIYHLFEGMQKGFVYFERSDTPLIKHIYNFFWQARMGIHHSWIRFKRRWPKDWVKDQKLHLFGEKKAETKAIATILNRLLLNLQKGESGDDQKEMDPVHVEAQMRTWMGHVGLSDAEEALVEVALQRFFRVEDPELQILRARLRQ